MSDREARGLRSDEAYVLQVLRDPASELRDGIKVTAKEARQIDEAAIAKQVSLRAALGLVADTDWVRSMLADSNSVERLGIRVSREEAAALDRRVTAQLDVASAVVSYGEAHADTWAGAYIDQSTSEVVASFTGPPASHEAALRALIDPSAGSVRVRSVERSLAGLEQRNATLWTDEAQSWLRDQGLQVVGGGPRVVDNDVRLQLTAERPGAAMQQLVIDHFGGAGWLTVDVARRAVKPAARGDLIVRVVNEVGLPVEGIRCWAHPDQPGFAGDNEVQVSDKAGRCTWKAIGVTGYDVDLWRRPGEGQPLGARRATVTPSSVQELTITAIQP